MKGFNRPNQLFSLCGLNCGPAYWQEEPAALLLA